MTLAPMSQHVDEYQSANLRSASPSLRSQDIYACYDKEKGHAGVAVDQVDDQPVIAPDDVYPDGGLQAWLVIMGASCATISTGGYVNAWGVFQAAYEDEQLKGTSPSTIAWIGSVQFALIFLPALLTGRMFDLGFFRLPLAFSSVVLTVCTFLTAECTEYWQFLLCQGFGAGIACGIIYNPATSVVAHWFKKRRSTALGIVTTGSSVGGMIFPIMFHKLGVSVGFKWAMRIFGFFLIFTLSLANLTMRRRLAPMYVSGGLLNLKQFRSTSYSLYTAAGFIVFLGLYTVLTYIDASAPSQGVTGELSFYLVAIANASSGFGRIWGGLAADRMGPLTVMIPATGLAGILTYVWPFLHGRGPIVTITIFYGMASGIYGGLLSAPMMALGETEDVGRRTGMFMTIMSLGSLAGPPISGAINKATGGYDAVGIYAGSTIMVAVVLLSLSRYYVLHGFRGKV